jgi:hypothetical protein
MDFHSVQRSKFASVSLRQIFQLSETQHFNLKHFFKEATQPKNPININLCLRFLNRKLFIMEVNKPAGRKRCNWLN